MRGRRRKVAARGIQRGHVSSKKLRVTFDSVDVFPFVAMCSSRTRAVTGHAFTHRSTPDVRMILNGFIKNSFVAVAPTIDIVHAFVFSADMLDTKDAMKNSAATDRSAAYTYARKNDTLRQ